MPTEALWNRAWRDLDALIAAATTQAEQSALVVAFAERLATLGLGFGRVAAAPPSRPERNPAGSNIFVMREDAAAKMLGISVRTLQRWRVQGDGPKFRKLGRKLVVYAEKDLLEFVERDRRG